MAAKILTLLDKKDNFEIIRDEIAAILYLEMINQQALAAIAGQDPNLYLFDVYIERSSPWELIESIDGEVISQTPLINVSFDNMALDPSRGDNIEMFVYNGVFNIDCLAAKTNEIVSGQIKKGDELASKDVQRIFRLARNILAASVYHNLNLTSIIHGMTLSNIQMYQPNINNRPAQHVIGARLTANISFNEHTYQYEYETLETIFGNVIRASDNKVYFSASFDVSET
jgi:hypothetical protein